MADDVILEPPTIRRIIDIGDTRAMVWALCHGPHGHGKLHATYAVLACFEGAPFTAHLEQQGWRFVATTTVGRRHGYWLCPRCADKRERGRARRDGSAA